MNFPCWPIRAEYGESGAWTYVILAEAASSPADTSIHRNFVTYSSGSISVAFLDDV